jgi:hypothetical protein
VLVIAFYVGNDFREVAMRDEVRLSVLGGNLQELGLQRNTGAIPPLDLEPLGPVAPSGTRVPGLEPG